jgi:ketosteroid isomerase-like protein
MMHANNRLRLRRRWGAACRLAALLLLGTVQPMHAQTTGDQAKQMSDEQIGKMLAAADSYTVDAVNRHDAYAVAADFWDDGIEVTPLGVFSGRAEIEQRLAEQYKATDVRDFAETIDEIHVSGDHGWFLAHWSANNTEPGGERRLVKGYITCVLEKRNGEWKVRMHTTFPSSAQ